MNNHEKMRFYMPCVPLRPYVRGYWTFRSGKGMNVFTFPTGSTQIIFHRRTPLFVPELGLSQHRVTVSGQVDFSSHLRARGCVDMTVVVFRPHAMSAFLGVPSSLFYNREISGSMLGDKSLDELAERICSPVSPDCLDADADRLCIARIEDWLTGRLAADVLCQGRRGRSGTAELNLQRADTAVRMLHADTRTSVASLASACCLGKKQFERVFSSFVGINPKEYARVVRFQKALAMMQSGEKAAAGLSQLAYSSGYADQSHLVREFRALCGHTPVELAAFTSPYSDLFGSPI